MFKDGKQIRDRMLIVFCVRVVIFREDIRQGGDSTVFDMQASRVVKSVECRIANV